MHNEQHLMLSTKISKEGFWGQICATDAQTNMNNDSWKRVSEVFCFLDVGYGWTRPLENMTAVRRAACVLAVRRWGLLEEEALHWRADYIPTQWVPFTNAAKPSGQARDHTLQHWLFLSFIFLHTLDHFHPSFTCIQTTDHWWSTYLQSIHHFSTQGFKCFR